MSEEIRELEEKLAWLRMCISEHLKRILELQQHKNEMKKELREVQWKLFRIRKIEKKSNGNQPK